MKKLILAVLILIVGAGLSSCGGGVVDNAVGWGGKKLEGSLKEMEQSQLDQLAAYLKARGMSIDDLDANKDGVIDDEDLKGLPGFLIMNPSVAKDSEFWKIIGALLGATYGHRTLRGFLTKFLARRKKKLALATDTGAKPPLNS